jgi:hypothetical protein
VKEACLLDAENPSELSCTLDGQRSGCAVTVGEAESCFKARTEGYRALTCESSFRDKVIVPPECETMNQKCQIILFKFHG